MMKKLLLLIIILVCSITISVTMGSCLKDLFDEKLPKATRTGANTFGCKIDGKSWIPDGTHDLFVSIPALSASIYQWQGTKYFHLSARKDPSALKKKDETYDDLYFDITLPATAGEIIIDKTCNNCGLYCPYNSIRFTIKSLPYGECYITDSFHPGKIHFTRIDTLNRIVSGTFEFKAIDKNTGKTINVTDGRFDVRTR